MRAALLVDLDRFGDVNAALGREAGDELLRQLAPRLRSAARPQDRVEHLGGDGYLVVCDGVAGPWEARDLAGRLAAAWAEPFRVADEELFVTGSIGVAVGGEDDGLLREADAAMHRAKASGRGTVEVYDDVLRAGALKRLRLEADFRRALAAGEIAVAFQPILDLGDGSPRAVEALARWTHPERGAVSPAVFVPLAERCGLIAELGRVVLREACRRLAGWRAEIPGAEDLWVSVNVSASQIASGELPGDVRDALGDAGLPPDALALEVTESALMEEVDAPGPVLALLRSLGVRILLDDFGTGYSSLGYLRRFPVDGLKLDRAFVDGVAHPDAAAVVEAIIGMARKLGLQLTAEGVETSEHAERLRALGCPLGQGYMLARPLPADMTGPALAERLQAGRLVT
jgi:diguanylate cyclase (GGDEF)-like protein